MYDFASPVWLWLLLILIPLIWHEIFFKRKKLAFINYPRINILKKVAKRSSWLEHINLILRCLTFVALILALARPRIVHKRQKVTGNGIDIMIAIDVSGSMLAVDFKPTNRLEAAKKVAQEFIEKRQTDRIGVTTFSGNSSIQCPITLDYGMLVSIMKGLEVDLEGQGTAIGLGLASAISRLKDSEAKSKVIILITDGVSNSGEINPIGAAQIAKTFGIKVYTIGVGREGLVDYPYTNPFGQKGYQKVTVDIDMETLNRIANLTGTEKAYRARNTNEFSQIFSHIDEMEKTKVTINNYFDYEEKFGILLILAFIFVVLEFFNKVLFNRSLPF